MEFCPLANPSAAYHRRRLGFPEQDLVSRLERPAHPSDGPDFSLRLASANCCPAEERGAQLPRVRGHCDLCFTAETPLWRKGPNGPKTLCNACGIRYKKELKKVKLTLGSASAHRKARSSQS